MTPHSLRFLLEQGKVSVFLCLWNSLRAFSVKINSKFKCLRSKVRQFKNGAALLESRHDYRADDTDGNMTYFHYASIMC